MLLTLQGSSWFLLPVFFSKAGWKDGACWYGFTSLIVCYTLGTKHLFIIVVQLVFLWQIFVSSVFRHHRS